MPNKPSLVINTNPLVALAVALNDFQVIGEVALLGHAARTAGYGVVGLLLVLQRRGLVASMENAIARMKAKGIHLSEEPVNEALRLQRTKP